MEKYFLHINEPCSQDWNNMTDTGKGKYCNNCQKTVFDFTNYKDNEIIKHITACNICLRLLERKRILESKILDIDYELFVRKDNNL